MYQNLKIKESNILSQTKLLNLGKINVICGKNSSGKTTLLEAINNKENVLAGKKFDDAVIKLLFSIWNEVAEKWTFQPGGSSQKYNFRQFVSKVPIEEVFEKLKSFRNIWFSDEKEFLSDKILGLFYKEIQDINTAQGQSYIPNPYEQLKYFAQNEGIQKQWKQIIDEIFKAAFSENFFPPQVDKTILILPKRIIYNKNQFIKVNEVDTDGSNIITKLFDSKNKRNGSLEKNFYNKLCKSFTEVSTEYEFEIEIENESANQLNLFFSLVGKNNWVEASKSGLGLQDLLIILYFALRTTDHLILIEEPENHLHPEMQRKLLRFLAEETSNQFFITTHSNIFVNSTYADRVFFTKFEDGKIVVNDETKQAEMLHDLGYSVTDNLVSDLIILVEGPSDTPIVEEFLSKMGIDAKYNIKTWALGGDIMDKHNLSVFAERYKVMALIDNDPKSKKSRLKFVNNCKEFDIPVTRLKRYAIENYFTVRVLRKVFKSQIPEDFTEVNSTKTLFEQININVKNNNRKLAKEMTLPEIEGTDLKAFFDNVQSKLKTL